MSFINLTMENPYTGKMEIYLVNTSEILWVRPIHKDDLDGGGCWMRIKGVKSRDSDGDDEHIDLGVDESFNEVMAMLQAK